MNLSNQTLLDMYWTMLLARRLDEGAWSLHRQGKTAFHFSGIGHEAIQVGAAFTLQPGTDWVAPYYRDLALLLALGLTPREFLLNVLARRDDPNSGGRQMPGLWSLPRANVLSVSTLPAAQVTQAVGVALGIKLRRAQGIVLCSSGEGAASQGEWYEGVNWAAVHWLPVVFLIQNNRYALSLPQEQQMAVENAADKARGLGLPGITVDGTDFLDVYRAVREAVMRARGGGGPSLVEARTYRITPHSSDDDDRSYRTREEVEAARKRDPLRIARRLLEADGVLDEETSARLEAGAYAAVEDALRFAAGAPEPLPEEAASRVYARVDDLCLREIQPPPEAAA